MRGVVQPVPFQQQVQVRVDPLFIVVRVCAVYSNALVYWYVQSSRVCLSTVPSTVAWPLIPVPVDHPGLGTDCGVRGGVWLSICGVGHSMAVDDRVLLFMRAGYRGLSQDSAHVSCGDDGGLLPPVGHGQTLDGPDLVPAGGDVR